MTGPAIVEHRGIWQAMASIHPATRPAGSHASEQNQKVTSDRGQYEHRASDSSGLAKKTSIPTPSQTSTTSSEFQDLDRYIALGCLHFPAHLPRVNGLRLQNEWVELIDVPEDVKIILRDEAVRLLDARWIRLFVHQSSHDIQHHHSIVRVYLLPEDWNRRYIDRNSRKLKTALRQLFVHVDTSPRAWAGDYCEGEVRHCDPWASSENLSLYYLFNKLPSPAPDPVVMKDRYTRAAVRDLLKSASFSEWEEHGEQPLNGLRTRLYPYQARSAGLMLQREAAPQLLLDPRLETRASPDGRKFFFGARDGSALHEPRYYEANRGGILAETMGLGKTLISLAVILATKGHCPKIPAAYLPSLPVRDRVGRLSDMAAATIGRQSVPARALIEQSEVSDGADYTCFKNALDRNIAFYEIPAELPRRNRYTEMPPPRQLAMCSGTIVVVPRNLLHQWQSEIRKHVLPGGLKVLVIDSLSKRVAKDKQIHDTDEYMVFASELPAPTELMKFDVVLFTRNRFEMEVVDVTDEHGRRKPVGVTRICNCPCIGSSRIPDCNCVQTGTVYESPLRKLHWLRIIIDEGHSFSSAVSNAVLVAKQISVERRWVVSGTPAKNLVGVELDTATLESDSVDASALRDSVIEQRKSFGSDDVEGAKAVKALGSMASNFLMVRPWCDSGNEGKLDWDEYMYRHEHQYKKTFSGFSSCFLRTLEGLVVKTRPEDVEKDIVLPPMTHRVVYLKPCWYDKMTANLFVQVLRANAITSERSDVDYLFHKNSVKFRHSLIRNLRQSNFTWTGFCLENVIDTVETTQKYLSKEDKKCSMKDEASLLESSRIVSKLIESERWKALSRAHEVGMAVHNWPENSEATFALAYPTRPSMIGITQLLDGQLHVDSNILAQNPADGLDLVGQAAQAKVEAMAEGEDKIDAVRGSDSIDLQLRKAGVPASCVGGLQPLTSRRASVMASKVPPQKVNPNAVKAEHADATSVSSSQIRTRKRKLTLAEEQAELGVDSPLRNTCVTATTSAKLTYLLDKVVEHQADEKIIIFYDGDDAAFYIAQCLEMLYINHRIYARTLDNVKRSEYVALFNQDPDVRVLLIDVACGALGLNLNAASVVLIVNPINRPGLEAQAIKRAHRIGQEKRVTVETLVLENTIEHSIFNHAKKMSRAQHLEAKELEDDAGIVKIIQNAQILPIAPEEEEGEGMFAKLKVPQQVFGRPERHKYHRYRAAEAKPEDNARKKAKMAAKTSETPKTVKFAGNDVEKTCSVEESGGSSTEPPLVSGFESSTTITERSSADTPGVSQSPGSLFGAGTSLM
ncbi:P-loop containing nucleoside triphosphate hydrolase protein [Ampelomyces quisqualis]|uniref:P-loop containing nucleoside triphosphate hydrolase protein n=1 Tax=Ampelomyces quisqualis TaxID=50730 RepID=A0A6A5QQB6_AMPQU|nr:P-loop containing nucleoside triphosphate hydrolase protein [Ampelomyces quisqualis]